MKYINGYKTYIAAIAWGVIGVCESQAWITPESADLARSLTEMLFGIGIGHKIAKMNR
jgi:hypothetical protein